MFVLFEISTSLVECILVHLLFHAWFGKRDVSQYKYFGILSLLFLVNCGFTLLPLLPIVRTLLGIVWVFVAALLLFRTTITTALTGALVNTGINVVVEYAALVALSLFSFDSSLLMQRGPERVTYVVIAKLINIIVILCVATILGHRRIRLNLIQMIPLMICQFISIYICQVFYQTMLLTQLTLVGFVIVLLGLLYINLIMIIFIENLTIAAKVRQEKALTEQNYALQRIYYEQVQRDQSNTHALWHDIKKYVLAIEAMAISGNDESIKNSIAFVKDSFSRVGKLVDVGNQEVNIILNHCIQKAESQGIHVRVNVSIEAQINISAIDLSVIIGNTMDNAIEECQKLSEELRMIEIVIKQKNNMLVYKIENPCSPRVQKKEGRNRGYGLTNIRNCIEKYDGTISTERDHDRYFVTIRLNIVEGKQLS